MRRPYAEVIGDPIGHSKSPLIHNFWLAKLGIDADYRSGRVEPRKLGRYFAERRADPDWRGCNIAMPHKVEAIAHLAALDEMAAAAGAANTAAWVDGAGLMGFNTDATGFLALIEARVAEGPCDRVGILFDVVGAGGTARAVAAALRGHEVTFFNRTRSKADALADELGNGSRYGFSCDLGSLDLPAAAVSAPPDERGQRYSEIVVNASSMGMEGFPPVPIRLDTYPADTIVVDFVYHPVITPLIRQAQDLGMRTIDGLDLLIAQAAGAFPLLFGSDPPRELDAELRALLTS